MMRSSALRKLFFHFLSHNESPQYDSAVMYGGFQVSPQLVPPDAERRQSLGQLKSVSDVFTVWQSFYTEKTIFPILFKLNGK